MIDQDAIRQQFPSLVSGDVFFDNPGGTQVPTAVIDAIGDCLRTSNANLGGHFATSRAADQVLGEARLAFADLLGAESPEEIVFGPNMTTLTLSLARALAADLGPGDELMVTRLDHDANVAPWMQIARDRGCDLRTVDFDPADCTLDLDDLEAKLSERTRLVAVGYASNAVGTVNPVREITELAHGVGALVFVDAVQLAPHRLVDVGAIGCDFLAVSAYKFFGPHLGTLWGRYEVLDRLGAYKVRPASNRPPGKFETGTQNHEGIAGARAAVDYLASLAPEGDEGRGRRESLTAAFESIVEHETELGRQLIATLEAIDGLRIYGITDPRRSGERVPTVAFTLGGFSPAEVATELGRRGIYVWDGDYYAVEVIARLGLAERGGMVRVGLAHYNTAEEIERLGGALAEIVSSRSARLAGTSR